MNVTVRVSGLSCKSLNPIWTFGMNTCHGALWLRPDLQHHIQRGVQELGLRYIRCHGLLNDDMNIVQPDGSFSFSKVHEAIQAILNAGAKPFFELSSMPASFAATDKSVTQYTFRSGPPKDWNRWFFLIHELILSLQQRFGKEEIRQWYFEVWNEPDLGFWAGTQQDYFHLYDLAALAIKQIDPSLRVGGPATSKTQWIEDFLIHVTQPSPYYPLEIPRCDFISTHAYPSDLPFLDKAEGTVQLQSSELLRTLFQKVRHLTTSYLGASVPVIIGEWNSSAGPFAENHDDCNNGAFVIKIMDDLQDICQGSLFWVLSDIYEECGFHYTPFHGGYGVYTVNDLPKAAAHAFRFLNQLKGERLDLALSQSYPGVGAMASLSMDGTILMIVYYYREPENSNSQAPSVTFSFPKYKIQKIETVEPGRGSTYETWLAMGKPDYINLPLLLQLSAASQPWVYSPPSPVQEITIPCGAFALLHLIP